MKSNKMNIISYSFFEPKQIYNDRFWDKFNNKDRYWYNIPAMVLLNKLIYPDFDITIHISSNVKENPLFEILAKLESIGIVNLVEIDREYSGTEPTLWRYKPLLDKSCDILLCRDIDSLPTNDEIRSTIFFINSEYKVSTIRSHTNHTTPSTIILAGLCGFRPKSINLPIKFEELINMKGNWGLDQSFLINSFIKDQEWTSVNFLDSKLSSVSHKVRNPLIRCTSFDESYYRENVKLEIDDKILKLLDKSTSWSGEPIDFRKGKLEELIDMKVEFGYMRDIINSNDKLKSFYL